MPLFKFLTIRRRRAEHFKSEVSGSITTELDRLVNTIKDAPTRKVRYPFRSPFSEELIATRVVRNPGDADFSISLQEVPPGEDATRKIVRCNPQFYLYCGPKIFQGLEEGQTTRPSPDRRL